VGVCGGQSDSAAGFSVSFPVHIIPQLPYIHLRIFGVMDSGPVSGCNSTEKLPYPVVTERDGIAKLVFQEFCHVSLEETDRTCVMLQTV
jgi:hypothetical protein